MAPKTGDSSEVSPARNLDPSDLVKARQKELLALARTSITVYLQSGDIPDYNTDDPVLVRSLGAFVTLRERVEPAKVEQSQAAVSGKGRLRGCIGYVWADKPLCQIVQRMAVAAATADPRLPPLLSGEIDQVNIEISVLSPLQPITDIQQIQIGVHGLMIVHGERRGVLLPQVAAERGWSRQEFLENLCHKAGLSPDCLSQQPKLYGFTTVAFEEE